jgi:hypothetical protein
LENYGKGIHVWSLYGAPSIEPIIESNVIENTESAIEVFTQAFGGGVYGVIEANTIRDDLQSQGYYGIVLRMHKEAPIVRNNTIEYALDGIHITYEDGDLLTTRLNNISGNTFTVNVNDVWCDTTQQQY